MTPYPTIRYSRTVCHGMHAGWSQRLSTASALAIATGLIEVDAATVATSPTVIGPLNEMTNYDDPRRPTILYSATCKPEKAGVSLRGACCCACKRSRLRRSVTISGFMLPSRHSNLGLTTEWSPVR